MAREKYEPPNPRRAYTIMTPDEAASAAAAASNTGNKKPHQSSASNGVVCPASGTGAGSNSAYGWYELEITGSVKNLSPDLFKLSHLTVLYLNDNNLTSVPPEITRLSNLMYLDLSANKLRSLPPEIGDLIKLRELHLNHNYIRTLPLELGRLFQLVALGLKGNPLAPEILHIYSEANGTSKLLTYLLDNLMMIACHGSGSGTTPESSSGAAPETGSASLPSKAGIGAVPSLLDDPIPPRPFIPISVARQRVVLQQQQQRAAELKRRLQNAPHGGSGGGPDGSEGFFHHPSTGRMNYIHAFTSATSTDGDGAGPGSRRGDGTFRTQQPKPDFFAIADLEEEVADGEDETSSAASRDGPDDSAIFLGPESVFRATTLAAAARRKSAQQEAEARSECSSRLLGSELESGAGSSDDSSGSRGSEGMLSLNPSSGEDNDDHEDAAGGKDKGTGKSPAQPDEKGGAKKVGNEGGKKKRRELRAKRGEREEEDDDTAYHNAGNTFTLMCYNILCDKYATRQLYGYCPTWAMAWDYRRELIRRQLESYSADVICLQEVETDQFHTFFQPQLGLLGYEGIFAPKSRAKTMREDERRFVDGCAIFYKTCKFELVKSHVVEFNQVAIAKAEGSENMLNRVMTKDNIGLTALLRTVNVPNKRTSLPAKKSAAKASAAPLGSSEDLSDPPDDLKNVQAASKGGTFKVLPGTAKDDLSLLTTSVMCGGGGLDASTKLLQERVKSSGHVESLTGAGVEVRPGHKRRSSDTVSHPAHEVPETVAASSEIDKTAADNRGPSPPVKISKVKRSISLLESGPNNGGKVTVGAESLRDLSEPAQASPKDRIGATNEPRAGRRSRRQRRTTKSGTTARASERKTNLLVVSTAHIHWDPEYSDVKIIQAMMIVHELKHFIKECYDTYCKNSSSLPTEIRVRKTRASETDKKVVGDVLEGDSALIKNGHEAPPASDTDEAGLRKLTRRPAASTATATYAGNNLIPLVLCGDLNSLPDSGVLEFLLTGRIEVNHAEFKDMGYKACLAKLTCDLRDTGHYTHSFKLASAYKPSMMAYTNFTYDFCGVLDYILHSKKFLEARALLGPLDQEWITRNKIVGAPHPNVPSDHFPIMVEYAFKDKPTHSRPPTHMA